ncbi:AzlD family protein [Aquibium carbonis]|uniref:AzlD family protein n=1 Tax=Aquibium carbonis TaxID=2495581 RepID=A0A3S0A7Y3_9HYPH|nr:AzlD domain-containing protein [Aquibium carbonis]RST86699.1 AzlD family protein [Aquibium carbonis]
MSEIAWIVLAAALMTYLTRAGGHLVLSRFSRIHPRVEAGLNAVPAAVFTTLIAPAAMNASTAEALALVAAALIGLWGGMFPVFLGGGLVLIVGRYLLG